MELIKKLTSAFGPSGNEENVANIIIEEIKEYVDEIKKDNLGNVIAVKRGNGKGKIMYTAHMDQIGILLLEIEKNGLLRFTTVGSINPMSLLNQIVVFENGVCGRIMAENIYENKDLKIKNMFIDIGESDYENACKKVSIGCFGVIKSDFIVNENRIITGALDNRISCFALIETIKKLKGNECDVYFVFTVHEETYVSGAAVSAYAIEPDIAVAVDVTFSGDSLEGVRTVVKLGEGTCITIMDDGLISHPQVKNYLLDTAKKYGIKYQFDIAKGATDGSAIHTTRTGIKTGAVAIPLRYMHTPYEIVDMTDVEYTIDLLLKAAIDYKK
ncbi:MAG: M20/M25/M40 family metallo-hydrolase [Caloramator sp.]|nr:M20/M25/M40 family metallo-hydrolase [Caloramator sp.]